MFKIAVPKPCHQNWDEMTPREQGRFCSSCEKTVVDFTAMNDEAVKNYFLSRMDQKTCGRFTSSQLDRVRIDLPSNIFNLSMPAWKRFLVACLVIFSTTVFSCNVSTNGSPLAGIVETDLTYKDRTDTIPKNYVTVGMIAPLIIADTLRIDTAKICTPITGTSVVMPVYEQGDVAVLPAIPEVPERLDTVIVPPGIQVSW